MVPSHSRSIAIAGAVAGFVFAFSQLSWSQPQKPQGISNFGQVSDSLFRGAQPSSAAYAALHDMGVAIVVNFRDEAGEIEAEKQRVESAGMKYVNIPWKGSDEPSNAQVAQFLDLVRANPNSKIFVHCKAGADRTGVMVAAYRIAVERKPVDDAVSEMHQYHYHWLLLGHLQRYVKSLPQLLDSQPVFSAYATAPGKNPIAPPATAAIAAPVLAPSLAQ